MSHLTRYDNRPGQLSPVIGTLPAFTMATFNLLVQWYGFPTDKHGFVPLSIAEFSL